MVFQKELKSCLLSGSAILCAAMAALAQQAVQPPHTVRASADAVITGKPDRAEISLSVYSQAATSEAASQQNASATSELLSALKRAVGSEGQIKTSGFFTSPQMQYPKNGGTPKITGYSATNRLTVTLDDLKLVAKLLDTAIGAGATQIQGVNFSIRDDAALRDQALTQASRKAYASAEAIAKALNLTVGAVLKAETTSQAPPPMPMFRAAQTVSVQAEATPIEPGDIDIHASVTVTLEVH